jgi:2-haloacid dehalogenase
MPSSKLHRRSFLSATAAFAGSSALAGTIPPFRPRVKALVFDVFGTVVDWRGSIIREGARWNRAKGLNVDWAKFADRWRAGYMPIMDRVRKGSLPWMKLDLLNRMLLDDLLNEFAIHGLSEEEKQDWNHVWHRLTPWPDAVAGLTKLKTTYIISTLSNGNVSLLLEMAKNAGLPWDLIMSAELFHHFKMDPEVYRGAVDMLGYKPEEVMLVAAHSPDLRAAQACGLKTGFVPRPLEYGPAGAKDLGDGRPFDVTAKDFVDLAAKLV